MQRSEDDDHMGQEKKKKEINSNYILEMLSQKYRYELFIPEFRNSPSGYTRRIDAMLIWLHPSRSKNIECFEIKTRRADWMNELKTPAKSDGIAKHCDKIWLVTSNEKIAKMEEIPDNWGWMYPRGKRFKIMKQAPKLNPIFDRDFLLTVAQYVDSKLKIQIVLARNSGFDDGRKFEKGFGVSGSIKTDYKECTKNLEECRKTLNTIEDVAGINFRWENTKNIREIMQLVKSLRRMNNSYSLESLETNLNDVKNSLEELKKKSKELNRKMSDVVKKLKSE